MKRKDLLTGDDFIPKRSNQKFVSSENRIKYNNNKAKELRQKNSSINKALHKNIVILNELLLNKSEVTLHKLFLLGKGLNFAVFTHFAMYENHDYPSIYQYTFIPQEGDMIKIIRK